jgi:type IV secretory pathway VirB2 component (pilin)
MMNKTKPAQAKAIALPLSRNKFLFISFITILTYMVLCASAYAQGMPTPMGDVLCTVVIFFYGNLGRGLASLAIIVLGVGALLGKTSWGLALTVGVGISVMFGAEDIADLLLGTSAYSCT